MAAEVYTYSEGLAIAKRYGLETEYMESINAGYTPTEALEEWDLLPYVNEFE